jgi:hypothetical protein
VDCLGFLAADTPARTIRSRYGAADCISAVTMPALYCRYVAAFAVNVIRVDVRHVEYSLFCSCFTRGDY